MVVGFFLVGCGDSVEEVQLETSAMTAAFSGHGSEGDVSSAASQLSNGDFSGGLKGLLAVAKKGDLADEQIDAILNQMTQVQQIMSQNADKSDDDAWAASRQLGDLLGSM